MSQKKLKFSQVFQFSDVWVRIYKRVLSRWKALGLALFFIVIVAATQPMASLLLQPMLDNGFGPHRDPRYVWIVPVLIMALFAIRGIFMFLSSYLMSWISNGVLTEIRDEMFSHMLSLPDNYFKQHESSRVLNRFVIDAGNVMQVATEVITTLVRETLIVVALIGLLFYLSWELTLMMVIVIPIAAVITRYFSKRLRRINQQTILMNQALTQVVSESINGQRVVKLFDGYQRQKERFSFINQSLRRFSIRNNSSSSATSPITQFVASVIMGAVVAVAMSQSGQDGVTVGTFAAFVTAMLQIMDPLKRLTNITGPMQRMLVSAESVFSLLDEAQESNTGRLVLTGPVSGRIEFKGVCQRYPEAERDTLKHINLLIEPGQTVAFIGRSGSGKTTLVSLLPRFADLREGTILLDEQNIGELTLSSLRSTMSLVSQEVVLFDGSLANNVAYGATRPVSDDEIMAALEAANLGDFVRQLPDGLDTHVGENASRLSGGQRQRLAIARALIKNAPILILDEATSALDNESERQVQASLERLMQGRTTLVIAHRLSTIVNADKIVVLDSGEIIETGTHTELLAKQGVYANLFALQFADVK